MPPKRKASGKKAAAPKPAKITKQDSVKLNIAAATKALQGKKKQERKKRAVDKHVICSYNLEVHDDYDCMLNQTNIGHNNNKYYVIQLLKTTNNKNQLFFVWNRWGRVGEVGANQLHGPFSNLEDAVKNFEKKFLDKTRNNWANRDKFQAMAGKYALLEMGDEEEDEEEEETEEKTPKGKDAGKGAQNGSCGLDKEVQSLLEQIFDNDMFKHQMTKMNLNVTRMPLGKLSKQQIAKGFEALDKIDAALKKKANSVVLKQLSSDFFTVIPHDFGRQVPPVISTREQLREKLDMLLVLGDIQEAQEMKKAQEKKKGEKHPMEAKYESLGCTVKKVQPSSKEFKVVETFLNNTGPGHVPKLRNLFQIDRVGEDARIQKHKNVKFRKLLWHGTSPAVVAAILKSGLRIMPHSGGLVGKGIYFASAHAKSYCYTGRTSNHVGFMFLNEVVLGKQKEIYQIDTSLTAAPPGYDSVLAKGRQEPDPKFDEKLKFDDCDIIVPIGKPKQHCIDTSFGYSEYLVYKESQVRMRYLCELVCK